MRLKAFMKTGNEVVDSMPAIALTIGQVKEKHCIHIQLRIKDKASNCFNNWTSKSKKSFTYSAQHKRLLLNGIS